MKTCDRCGKGIPEFQCSKCGASWCPECVKEEEFVCICSKDEVKSMN